ncbi:hypothetical protein L1987_81706 [Smallanthus sonchifolius]|uniref:Uncharacterized protein n=1 Tax=Smallanthus sonchifolius TaxID=185202 RepID=A0ACB8YVG0_9ASTR|nr:hypothetical protein L1987_81706 [Smallanthus sonchifolius]
MGVNAGVPVCPDGPGVVVVLGMVNCGWFGGKGCEMGRVVASVKTGELGSDIGPMSRYPRPVVLTLTTDSDCKDGGVELIWILVLADTDGANEDKLVEPWFQPSDQQDG